MKKVLSLITASIVGLSAASASAYTPSQDRDFLYRVYRYMEIVDLNTEGLSRDDDVRLVSVGRGYCDKLSSGSLSVDDIKSFLRDVLLIDDATFKILYSSLYAGIGAYCPRFSSQLNADTDR